MKTTTIRELKHEMTAVLAKVAEGESFEVLRRGKPVAVLSPRKRKTRRVMPDFSKRLQAIYGDRILSSTASDLIAEARGDT